MNFISKNSDESNKDKLRFKKFEFGITNNSEESITIINEDNFEASEPNIQIQNKKNNDEKKLRPKTSHEVESNQIQIKDIAEEEQLRFDFQREYKKYRTDRNKVFLERMTDDINKRKKMEEAMDKFIKKSKLKKNEEDKIIIFNRLIEDTNRRFDEKEKIIQDKEEEEKGNIELLKRALNKENKKYNKKEWNKIYHKRFETFEKKKYKKYIKNVSNEVQEELDLYEEEKPKKLPKYKNKKEVKQVIENNIKNLYNDYIIRKQKMINKEKNLELLNKNNKLLYSEELNKTNRAKKFRKSNSKTKYINNINIKSIDIKGLDIKNFDIKNNFFKENLKASNNKTNNCFTPKSLKAKNIYKISNKEKNPQNNNNNDLGGEMISEILINKFLMNHGK
jgi:hypothetical protein